jgi:hypothetical protein
MTDDSRERLWRFQIKAIGTTPPNYNWFLYSHALTDRYTAMLWRMGIVKLDFLNGTNIDLCLSRIAYNYER